MHSVKVAERFWAKVDPDPDGGCWQWMAGVNQKGYGTFTGPPRDGRRGATLKAHRVAYELLVGPIPEGLCIDHLCRNRACVNPGHMEPVTGAENVRRGEHHYATHCPHGHEYTPENTYVNPKGHRICRTCGRLRDRLFYRHNPSRRARR